MQIQISWLHPGSAGLGLITSHVSSCNHDQSILEYKQASLLYNWPSVSLQHFVLPPLIYLFFSCSSCKLHLPAISKLLYQCCLSSCSIVFIICLLCCPPPFRRKARGHSIRHSVVRGAWFRVYNRYLVSATPPTVFNQSFWNFTGVFIMVWRCACAFYRILKLFFFTLLHF